MQKVINQVLLTTLLLALSGCATYNSMAPEWAQVGAEQTETSTEGSDTKQSGEESVWWNPLSWF
jgi:hypothetical protein